MQFLTSLLQRDPYSNFQPLKAPNMKIVVFPNIGSHLIWSYKEPGQNLFRVLDKSEYLVIIRENFCRFCLKTYIVTPHLTPLDETVQMRSHNIWFQ